MISLVSIPERIKEGETLKVKLDIQGKNNLKMYKGVYFNLILRKNGGTLGPITLYPLKFNGFSLEWEVNPNSYGSSGTFNVSCIIQDGNQITGTTFIIEPDCIIGKINTCNNITSIECTKNFKESQIKKQEIPIDFTGGCQIQKPGTQIKQEIIDDKIIKENLANINLKDSLVSGAKVQKIIKNINSN